MSEKDTGNSTPPELERKLNSKEIRIHNGRIIRRLRKLFADNPEVAEILDSARVEDHSVNIPTFDRTPNGGLDMLSEWKNIISSSAGKKIIKVQHPSAWETFQESIILTPGFQPHLEVNITLINDYHSNFDDSLASVNESKRILDRLSKQLALKKKVLNLSD
jgi:hypothetical protein